MKLLFLQFGVIMWGLLAWSSRAQETKKAFDKNLSTMIQGKGNAEMEQEGENNHNRILRQAKQYSENDVEPFNVFSGSTNYNQENKYHRPPLQKQYARYEPPSPLDKINGGVVMREMVDEPMIRALDSLRGEAFGITRRFDLLDQSHPMRYYRKLIESRGLRPRPKAIFDEIDRVGIQGFGKRNDQSDKGELRNFEKKNFDEVDKSGFRDFGKRNFDEIDKSGFRDFGKRNFDEIDKSGFGDFGKRNFDEIDKSGFRDFGKRNFHEAEESGFRGSRKRNFDEVDKSGFRDFGKRNFDEIDQVGFRDFGKRSINQAEIGETHLRKVKESELRETENEGAKIKSISNQMRSNGTRNSQQGEI